MRPRSLAWTLWALTLAAGGAGAHDFAFTDVTVRLTADGAFQADVTCDLDALALGVDATASDSAELAAAVASLPEAEREAAVARLGELLKRRLRVRFDEQPAPFAVTLPERGRPRPAGAAPSALGVVARLQGTVPPGARTVSFFASRAFPPVRLSVRGADGRTLAAELLERGEASAPIALAPGGARAAAAGVVLRFLRLGFGHILPHGLDHVLFVVGLALLTTRPRPLLAQVSAFTAAHTLTLALAVYGVVALPSRVVEPLIAASILYVAVENLARRQPWRWRLALVFAFGLLHGLGFAGALTELGWPAGRRLAALVAFNAGVELGQLTVMAAALALLHLAGRARLPRRRLEQALSAAMGAVAVVWTVQRLLG